jgi:hypothetical protein
MTAIVFTVILAMLAVFQIALVFGAPLGEYAWGGQRTGRLPAGYRVGSAVSIVLYLLFAAIVLSRSGIISLIPDRLSVPGAWIVFAYLALGTLMNAISRSRKERIVMTPVAAVLAVLALIVALA